MSMVSFLRRKQAEGCTFDLDGPDIQARRLTAVDVLQVAPHLHWTDYDAPTDNIRLIGNYRLSAVREQQRRMAHQEGE